MTKYYIEGRYTEYLGGQVIEAKTQKEAEDKYRQMWDNGSLFSSSGEMELTHLNILNGRLVDKKRK